MKILFYDWEALSQKGLIKGLMEMGHEVITYSKKIKNHLMDETFLEELAVKLVKEDIELAMSFNFFPMVSMACRASKRAYISWVYSCPHYPLYTEASGYEGNFFFIFDRNLARKLISDGLPNVFHLPLAVDYTVFQKGITYRAEEMEISFVGSLYTDERNYFDQIQDLPPYLKGYVDGICDAQRNVFGMDLITACCSDTFLNQIEAYIPFRMDPGMKLSFRDFLISIIQKKTTIEERSTVIKTLSEKNKVDIYTGSDTKHLPNIRNRGRIDYYSGMPEVFRKSKFNLNITLRSITSGIPLRALDIMGSGGLLLSNYQEELAENFKNGEEILLWGSIEELQDIIEYYQRNETERKKIMRNGFNKVKKDFSYDTQLRKMFGMIVGDM